MKTAPDTDKEKAISKTEVAKITIASHENVTEMLPYTKIVRSNFNRLEAVDEGRISHIDCAMEFSFEKERIKAIEHTQLFASLNTASINQDSVLNSSKTTETIYNKQLLKVKATSELKEMKESVAKIIKTMSIVLTLIATVNIIGAFFAILFISLSSIPISGFIVWLSMEILVTIIFTCVSLKGSNASQFTSDAAVSFFKWLLSFLVMIIAFITVVSLQQSITSTFECALNWRNASNTQNESIESMKCVVMLALFFSSLYKLLVIIIYLILCVILRKRLIEFEAAEPESLASPSAINASSSIAPYRL